MSKLYTEEDLRKAFWHLRNQSNLCQQELTFEEFVATLSSSDKETVEAVESDAVAFVKWILENAERMNNGKFKYWFYDSGEAKITFTTNELYEIFKEKNQQT